MNDSDIFCIWMFTVSFIIVLLLSVRWKDCLGRQLLVLAFIGRRAPEPQAPNPQITWRFKRGTSTYADLTLTADGEVLLGNTGEQAALVPGQWTTIQPEVTARFHGCALEIKDGRMNLSVKARFHNGEWTATQERLTPGFGLWTKRILPLGSGDPVETERYQKSQAAQWPVLTPLKNGTSEIAGVILGERGYVRVHHVWVPPGKPICHVAKDLHIWRTVDNPYLRIHAKVTTICLYPGDYHNWLVEWTPYEQFVFPKPRRSLAAMIAKPFWVANRILSWIIWRLLAALLLTFLPFMLWFYLEERSRQRRFARNEELAQWVPECPPELRKGPPYFFGEVLVPGDYLGFTIETSGE